MAVKTFQPTDYQSQTVETYEQTIDDNFAVVAGPAGAFAVHEQSTPDMSARVDAGVIAKGDGTVIEAAAQNTGTITAPSTDPRNDIVYLDLDAGTVGVATGTEAASPTDPEFPLGSMPVARLNLTTSTTSITNAIIDDCRPGGGQPDRFEQLKHVEKTGNADIKRNNAGQLFVANSASAITFSLDPAAQLGPDFVIWVKNVNTGQLTVLPDGSETIDGDANLLLDQTEAALICRAGSNFRSIGIIGENAGTGTVTQVDTGAGLTGGPITTSGTISVSDGGIDTLQLAADSVTSAEIAADAVGSSEIAAGAVGTSELADDAVTLAKMEHGSQGDILYYGASGVPTRLAAGTDGQFLKTQGTGADPVWADVPGGGAWTLIATVTASNATSVDFDGNLSSTYSQYCVIGTDINPATDGVDFHFRTDSNGGASYDNEASDYSWQAHGMTGTALVAMRDAADQKINLTGTSGSLNMGGEADEGNMLVLWINNPSGTTFEKTVMWNLACNDADDPNAIGIVQGAGKRLATDAIDSFQFRMSSGNLDGEFRLYGIANS